MDIEGDGWAEGSLFCSGECTGGDFLSVTDYLRLGGSGKIFRTGFAKADGGFEGADSSCAGGVKEVSLWEYGFPAVGELAQRPGKVHLGHCAPASSGSDAAWLIGGSDWGGVTGVFLFTGDLRFLFPWRGGFNPSGADNLESFVWFGGE